MANAITLAEQYTKVLDDAYKWGALTGPLEVNDEYVRGFDNAGTIHVLNMVLDGLGDYDRATGFPAGDITATWDAYTLDNDRAKSFNLDVMDDAEANHMIFGNVASQFMKQHTIPEVDATRFAKLANAGTTPVQAALADGDAYLAAIDVALLAMDEAEVPEEDRIIYISNEGFSALKTAGTITRNFDVENSNGTVNRKVWELDGIPVVKVPSSRFATAITLDADGYTLGGTAINFQIVSKSAVKAITRHVAVRYFSAQVNQSADADKYDYRIYHDLIVPAQKTAGVYTHAKAV